jgi:hypothetical protein
LQAKEVSMPGKASCLRLAAFILSGLGLAGLSAGQTYRYTVTNIAAASFQPAESGQEYYLSGSGARFIAPNQQQFFWTALTLPTGAIVDYIGINNLNDGTPIVVGAALYERLDTGELDFLAGTSNTPHTGWQTDLNSTPFAQSLTDTAYASYLLRLEFDSSPSFQYIGAVQVWWRTEVNSAVGTPTFNDVPVSDFGYDYIENLASSGITGGCGGNNYCPDSPVTRRQMAIFLAKALGLNYTYTHE